jgi:hypothetical protein
MFWATGNQSFIASVHASYFSNEMWLSYRKGEARSWGHVADGDDSGC